MEIPAICQESIVSLSLGMNWESKIPTTVQIAIYIATNKILIKKYHLNQEILGDIQESFAANITVIIVMCRQLNGNIRNLSLSIITIVIFNPFQKLIRKINTK